MKNIRLFLLCLLCVLFVDVTHSQITTLDWDELRIDTMMPVYTEVVPLESDYRQNEYVVSIEYPEWGELSRDEVKRLERIGAGVGEELQVYSHVSVSRKQGMLDIAFVPIVKREGKYRKLLSASIVITAKVKGEGLRVKGEGLRVKGEGLRVKGEGERYTKKSVLAEGKWVKLSIAENGMYRLTRSALQKMGFSNPDNVRLYGHGGHRLSEVSNPDSEYDDLEEVPLYKVGNDTWLFWGNGLVYWDGTNRVFNPYASQAFYFLTEGSSPSEITTTAAQLEPVTTYQSFPDHELYEKDEYAWFHGGRNLYENVDYASSNTHTYKFAAKNSLGQERLTIAFTAAATSSTTMTPYVNGNALSPMTMSKLSNYIYATQATTTTDVSKYKTGNEWTVRLVSTAGNPARLDYLALHYERLLAPTDGYVAFSENNSNPAQFSIVGKGLKVMRIGQPRQPATIIPGTQSSDGNYYNVNVDDASLRYVAFDPEYNFPQPTVVGSIDNQNLHGLDSLDMVIIIPVNGKLTAQAERLAEAHRQFDGLRVAVVRADKVYNEFSSGTPDATAYRRLMKMLYDRAQSDDQMPRYLLLFGDCAWDNRMLSTAWRRQNPNDYLLCFESENSFSDTQSFVMEDYFGLLDDGEGANLTDDKVDIGVGRFPVTTEAEAKVMVDKSIRHLTNANAGNWKNVIAMLGDDGDNNEHLEMADDVAERIIKANPEMEVRKVMWDSYQRVSSISHNLYPAAEAVIRKQMDEGALVMNYTGHAATYALSHEFVLEIEDFSAFSGERLPLWVTAACDVMPFDGQSDNIGERAVLNSAGAAVAFYGTARTVYADRNLQMNRWFMQFLLATDSVGRRYRVGDAIRLAKNYLIDKRLETSNRENKLHYALLGDPALTFGAPTNRVVLDSINGQVPVADNSIQLRAGEHVRMVGHVESAEGDTLRQLNGILTARVYDNLENITCLNNANASKGPFQYTSREKILFNGLDSVRNGSFAINYVMPVDINFSNESGRAVFYVVSEDRSIEANGYNEAFTVGGVSTTIAADTIGPKMFAYLNTEDFENGGRVNATPYFVAQLQDESGISYGGGGLGHDLLLTIDGDATQTYVLNDYYTADFGDYTRGTVAYSIPSLSDGPHSLKFRAWDVLNNTSCTTLDFVVDGDMKPTMFHITATQNPALTSTIFLINYNMPGTDCDLTFEVFDFAGRRMWSQHVIANTPTGTYSLPWNLTMNGGGRLGAGIYLYRATLRQGNSKKTTKSQKIIIHGNK